MLLLPMYDTNGELLIICLASAACVDCFDWCPSQTKLCNTGGFIQEACRKSCNSCVPVGKPQNAMSLLLVELF